MHTKDYIRFLFTVLCICFCMFYCGITCHADSFTEGYLTYTENEDGTLTVTGYTPPKTNLNEIIINNVVNNKTVTAIADSVFQDIDFLSVSIDNNISIGAHAFSNTFIRYLTIGTDNSGMNVINAYAFDSADLSYTHINSNLELGNYCFRDAYFFDEIVQEDEAITTTIGKGAFMDSNYADGLNLSSLTSIGENAFRNTNISHFTIPSTITEIGKGAFEHDNAFRRDRLKITIDSSITNIENFHFENADTFILEIDANGPLADYCATNNILHHLLNESETSTNKANINQVFYCDSYTAMVTGANTASLLSLYSTSDYICIDEQYNINYHGYTYVIDNIESHALDRETCPYTDTVVLGDTITQLEDFSIIFYYPNSITLSPNMKRIEIGAFQAGTNITTIIIPPGLTTLTQQIATCFASMNVTYSINENNPLIAFFKENELPYTTYKSSASDDSESDNNSTPNNTFTEGYLTYTANEDGTLTVTGYDPSQYINGVPLEIKNTVNGKMVTNIADYAFQGKWFEYIAIDNNIDIGNYAFENVTVDGKLPETFAEIIPEPWQYGIYIGNNASGENKIGKYAFASAQIYQKIILHSNISIDDFAFKNSFLGGIYQPDSIVTHIGNNAFDGSYYTSGLNYSGLISVGSNAFKGCKLTEFTIPSTLKTLETTFSGGDSSDYFHIYIDEDVADISSFSLENVPFTIFHISANSPLSTYCAEHNMLFTVVEDDNPDTIYSKPITGQLISNDTFDAVVTGESTTELLRLKRTTDSITFDETSIVDYHGYPYTITSLRSNSILCNEVPYLHTIHFGNSITKVASNAIVDKSYNITYISFSNTNTIAESYSFPNSDSLTVEFLPSVTDLDSYFLFGMSQVTYLVEEDSPLIQMLVDRNLTFQTHGAKPISPGSPDYPAKTPTESSTEATTETPTEPSTETPVETPTEPPTEIPTEPSTEATTETPIDPPAETPTEPSTEATTETPTKPPTEIPTEPSTETTPDPNAPNALDPNQTLPDPIPNTESASNNTTTTAKKPAIGDVFTYQKLQYKITGKKTVTFVKPVSKKITKLSLPSTAIYTINKKKYKYTVTKIEKKACYKCSKLKTVTTGGTVTSIGDSAFANCSSLKQITFGANVKTIGKKVLYHDTKLKKIKFAGTKVKSIGKMTFRKVPTSVDIIVPNSKVKKYSRLINNAI